MNYTRTLKEYCLQNKGSLFNISEEYENHFKMMPKKKYYKILNRLEEEGYLHKESHGVYFIFDDLEKKKNNNRVIRHYTSGQHGIIVGYHWYNEIGITDYDDMEEALESNKLPKSLWDAFHSYVIVSAILRKK